MYKALIIWTIFLCACGAKSSPPMQGEMILNDCQKRWKILELNRHFTGKVLFHSTASPACGILATGAVTIVQSTDGNTYRIIEYCNTDKNFVVGSLVIVKPDKNAKIPLIIDDKRQCELLETLFGQVEVAN